MVYTAHNGFCAADFHFCRGGFYRTYLIAFRWFPVCVNVNILLFFNHLVYCNRDDGGVLIHYLYVAVGNYHAGVNRVGARALNVAHICQNRQVRLI